MNVLKSHFSFRHSDSFLPLVSENSFPKSDAPRNRETKRRKKDGPFTYTTDLHFVEKTRIISYLYDSYCLVFLSLTDPETTRSGHNKYEFGGLKEFEVFCFCFVFLRFSGVWSFSGWVKK